MRACPKEGAAGQQGLQHIITTAIGVPQPNPFQLPVTHSPAMDDQCLTILTRIHVGLNTTGVNSFCPFLQHNQRSVVLHTVTQVPPCLCGCCCHPHPGQLILYCESCSKDS